MIVISRSHKNELKSELIEIFNIYPSKGDRCLKIYGLVIGGKNIEKMQDATIQKKERNKASLIFRPYPIYCGIYYDINSFIQNNMRFIPYRI